MANLAELLKFQLEELDNISYSSVSSSRGKPEARIMFDQYLMGINDVTPNNVVTELNNFAPQNTTSIKYKAGDQEYDIIIKDKRLAEKKEEENQDPVRTLEDLRNMQVTNTNNSLTELRSFSNINLTRGQGNINRVNQDKEITVNYRFNSDVNESKNILEAARTEIDELVQNTDIPTGIAVEVVHEEDETSEFTFLILAAFVIIYMILASVFESLTAPIVLMFAIPLAAIGSLLALLFTSNSLMNANVLIGVIILIGIVVNNSIILIDYTSQLRRQGNRKPRAPHHRRNLEGTSYPDHSHHHHRGHVPVSHGTRRICIRTRSSFRHHGDRRIDHEYIIDPGDYPHPIFRFGRSTSSAAYPEFNPEDYSTHPFDPGSHRYSDDNRLADMAIGLLCRSHYTDTGSHLVYGD